MIYLSLKIGKKMYEVTLDNEMELYFDMNGNFIKSEQD